MTGADGAGAGTNCERDGGAEKLGTAGAEGRFTGGEADSARGDAAGRLASFRATAAGGLEGRRAGAA